MLFKRRKEGITYLKPRGLERAKITDYSTIEGYKKSDVLIKILCFLENV